jgi:hypothetical protein
MKTHWMLSSLLLLMPGISAASPVDFASALEYVSSSISITTAGNGAAVSSLNGQPAAGAIGRTFSGSSSASGSVDIDDFSDANSEATLTWEYIFRVNTPGITKFSINYRYGLSGSVYSNSIADSNSYAYVDSLAAEVDLFAFHQETYFPARQDNLRCSSIIFHCGTDVYGLSEDMTRYLEYSPGYGEGAIISIRGRNRLGARASSSAGSAEASANSWTLFSISAVPAPSTVSLVFLGLVSLAVVGRPAARLQDQ